MARASTPATTVLPTSVPVPVTKTPSTARLCRWAKGCRPAIDPELPRGLADHPGCALKLVGTMVRHHGQAQPRSSLGDRRRPDRLREDPAVERPLAEPDGLACVAHHHRNDLRSRIRHVEVV